MKRLCTICARGGSKGVANKNIRPLLGKPLIAYSIEHAQATQLFTEIAVSSDSAEILEIARQYGVQHLVQRPADLAKDDSPKVPAIQHCLKTIEGRIDSTFDTVVDLDATAPLRTMEDVIEAVNLLEQTDGNIVLSGTPSRRSPYFNMVEEHDGCGVQLVISPSSPVVRRQDTPTTFDLNASIYVWKRDWLVTTASLFGPQTRLYQMPSDRSVDIDSELDFALVEFLLTRREQRNVNHRPL